MHRPFLAILSFVVACAACRAAEVPILAITHVNVIPVVRPGLLEDYTVVVVGGIIETVAPSAQVAIPSNAELLDCTDQFLIPGLADMHEHLPRGDEPWENSVEDFFDYQLAAGVTTIRTMRGDIGDIALRESVRAGVLEGPRLILGSPGMNAELAADPQTARSNVRTYAEAGFDFIKILGGFDLETFGAIEDEARALGIPIAGHLPRVIPMQRALGAPFWSIEHLHGHSSAWRADPGAQPLTPEALGLGLVVGK